jgi:hypothetical protein
MVFKALGRFLMNRETRRQRSRLMSIMARRAAAEGRQGQADFRHLTELVAGRYGVAG